MCFQYIFFTVPCDFGHLNIKELTIYHPILCPKSHGKQTLKVNIDAIALTLFTTQVNIDGIALTLFTTQVNIDGIALTLFTTFCALCC